MSGDWLDFIFGGVWCVLMGLRGDWYAMSVRRKSIRLQGCVWEGKIDDTNFEEGKSEDVID